MSKASRKGPYCLDNLTRKKLVSPWAIGVRCTCAAGHRQVQGANPEVRSVGVEHCPALPNIRIAIFWKGEDALA